MNSTSNTTETDENSNLNKEIINLTQRITTLESKVEKLESKNKQNLFGLSGKIINTEEEVRELFSFISNGRERTFRLLYSATLEENTKEDFHKYCDNKGSTIVLVETTNGKRFGGFTSSSWKSNDQWVNDPCACIFSFDNHRKYKLLLPQYAYYGGASYGPHFGNCDQLGFYKRSTGFLDCIHQGCFCTKTYDISSIEELTNTNTYLMNKFEVYQVI